MNYFGKQELMRQIISHFIRFKDQVKKVCPVFGILYQLELQPKIAFIASY